MAGNGGNGYRVHLADPGGNVSVHDVPSETFEATERGIVLHGTTVVPWHRVIRYERELTLTLGDPDLPTNAEIRAWLDDGTGSGEHLTVRADRFEPGPWTADFVIEGTMNVETSTLHLTKIHVPWTRVLEYERLFAPATMPARPD